MCYATNRSVSMSSMEALLIRAVQLRSDPCAMFSASRIEGGSNAGRFRLDYIVGSRGWTPKDIQRALLLPERTVLSHCAAIGFTCKGEETWSTGGPFRVEAIGIPPYPRSMTPRVVGLALTTEALSRPPEIEYVVGDATKPRGDGLRVLVQVVTDSALTWGGHGFAAAVRRAWPSAQEDFRNWAGVDRHGLVLGETHFAYVEDTVVIASIIAQHGYGASAKPRIRYSALRRGLETITAFARENTVTVHMPRIGCGLAGGSWDVVEELVHLTLFSAGIPVTVYDPPSAGSSTRNAPVQFPLIARH